MMTMTQHKFTIKQAIIEALKIRNQPSSPKEIFDVIVTQNLYHFKAKNPTSLVSSEIRSYCEGVSLKTSKSPKLFRQTGDKFELL